MTLYADTSALVKRYIREAGSDQVTSEFEQARSIATAAITQVEMASALAKAVQLGWVSEPSITQAWQDFLVHWQAYVRLPITTNVVERAAALAWQYHLRAYDALHLACALVWQDIMQEEVVFACFDNNLLEAARQAGLKIWPEP
jgi:predicted nucleic acid-binding protein